MQSQIILELSVEQAFAYQKAILAVLGKVEVGNCESIYKEHVKTVFELLGKLSVQDVTLENIQEPKLERTSNIEH